jgi:hypothetical protein
MTWGMDTHITERFAHAGVPKENISGRVPVHPVNSDVADNGSLDCKSFAPSDPRFIYAVYLPGRLVS